MAACDPYRTLIQRYAALVDEAQSILAQHVKPEGPNEAATVDSLLALLDGPTWRRIERARARLCGGPSRAGSGVTIELPDEPTRLPN
jgi:hypothetical protein